jgi:uncharacterized protein
MDGNAKTVKQTEIVAVVITALLKVIVMDLLQWKLLFIVAAGGGWILYIAYQTRRNPAILMHWGFRFDNFYRVLKQVVPFAIASVALFFGIGYFRDTLNLSWHIIPILLLYPLWGIVQQFLVIGLVAGNLQDLTPEKRLTFLIIIITAALFGLVHYPFYWLMIGTFLLAILYGIVYLRERNLLVLGIFHGWLGALFFYTVVGRDPYVEVFGKLFSMNLE